jgi:CheY-like chemotaxis protein
LLEKLGGNIWIELSKERKERSSIKENHGSIFIFTMKLGQSTTAAVTHKKLDLAKSESFITNSSFRKLSILVAEDDDLQREYLKSLLVHDFKIPLENIKFCVDGEQAKIALLENIQRCKNSESNFFQLVITDYNMPILNGIDMIKYCKDVYKKEEVKFPRTLLLTAIRDDRLKKSCLNQMDHFLEKPPTYLGLEEVFKTV